MLRHSLKYYLPFFGTLPFIACTSLLFSGFDTLPYLGDIKHIQCVYALVIATFMAGVHWGQHLNQSGGVAVGLAAISNVLAIMLWLGFVLFTYQAFILLSVIVFLVLLWVDKKLLHKRTISASYFTVRLLVTLIVILSLLVSVGKTLWQN